MLFASFQYSLIYVVIVKDYMRPGFSLRIYSIQKMLLLIVSVDVILCFDCCIILSLLSSENDFHINLLKSHLMLTFSLYIVVGNVSIGLCTAHI